MCTARPVRVCVCVCECVCESVCVREREREREPLLTDCVADAVRRAPPRHVCVRLWSICVYIPEQSARQMNTHTHTHTHLGYTYTHNLHTQPHTQPTHSDSRPTCTLHTATDPHIHRHSAYTHTEGQRRWLTGAEKCASGVNRRVAARRFVALPCPV